MKTLKLVALGSAVALTLGLGTAQAQFVDSKGSPSHDGQGSLEER